MPLLKISQRILEEFGYSLDDLELEFSDQLQLTKKKEPKSTSSTDTSPSAIERVEKKLGVNLEDAQVKRGRGKYFQTKDSSKSVVFLTSKFYEKPKCYWFGLRLNQIQFLTDNKDSYLALVCGSSDLIFLEQWKTIKPLTKNMHKTETEDRMYHHIKIFHRDDQFIIGLPELSNGKDISGWMV
jgi:hypothetical protein